MVWGFIFFIVFFFLAIDCADLGHGSPSNIEEEGGRVTLLLLPDFIIQQLQHFCLGIFIWQYPDGL